jgi:hypothetical protein
MKTIEVDNIIVLVSGIRYVKALGNPRKGIDPYARLTYYLLGECIGNAFCYDTGYITDKTVVNTGKAHFALFDECKISQLTYKQIKFNEGKKNGKKI